MEYTTDVVIESVQAMAPAPVYRVSGSSASADRLVSGQECFGSAAAVALVESASGTGLAGAAGVLGLVALEAGLLERQGYAGLSGISSDSNSSDSNSSKGDNGSKPMTLWDFHTSSPPG